MPHSDILEGLRDDLGLRRTSNILSDIENDIFNEPPVLDPEEEEDEREDESTLGLVERVRGKLARVGERILSRAAQAARAASPRTGQALGEAFERAPDIARGVGTGVLRGVPEIAGASLEGPLRIAGQLDELAAPGAAEVRGELGGVSDLTRAADAVERATEAVTARLPEPPEIGEPGGVSAAVTRGGLDLAAILGGGRGIAKLAQRAGRSLPGRAGRAGRFIGETAPTSRFQNVVGEVARFSPPAGALAAAQPEEFSVGAFAAEAAGRPEIAEKIRENPALAAALEVPVDVAGASIFGRLITRAGRRQAAKELVERQPDEIVEQIQKRGVDDLTDEEVRAGVFGLRNTKHEDVAEALRLEDALRRNKEESRRLTAGGALATGAATAGAAERLTDLDTEEIVAAGLVAGGVAIPALRRLGKSADEIAEITTRFGRQAEEVAADAPRIEEAAFLDPVTGEPIRTGAVHDLEEVDDLVTRRRIRDASAEGPSLAGFVDSEGNFLTREQAQARVGAERPESSFIDQAQRGGLGEAGRARSEVLQSLGIPAVGAAAGGVLDEESPGRGALIGGVVGAGVAGRGLRRAAQRTAGRASETEFARVLKEGTQRGRGFTVPEINLANAKRASDFVRRSVFDKAIPIRRLEEKADEALQGLVWKEQVETLARDALGDAGYAERVLWRGVMKAGSDERQSRAFFDILQDAGDNLDEFRLYGIARRVEELRQRDPNLVPRQIRENEQFQRELQEVLDNVDPKTARLFDEDFQELNRAWIRLLEEEGVLAPGSANRIIEQNQSYFPFFREIAEEGETLTGRTRQVVRRIRGESAEGEALPLVDPVLAYTDLHMRFANAIKRQRVQNGLVRLAKNKNVDTSDFIFKPARVDISRATKVSKDDLGDLISDDLREALPDEYATVWRGKDPDPQKRIVRWYNKDGEAEFWQLSDEMWNAIQNEPFSTTSAALSAVFTIASKAARTLRTFVTVSPPFAVRNVLRDAGQVVVTSKTKGQGVKALGNAVADAYGGMAVIMADAMPSVIKRASVGAAVGAGAGAVSDPNELRGAAIGAAGGAAIGARVGRSARKFAARAGKTPEQIMDLWASGGGMQAAFQSMDRNNLKRAIQQAAKGGQKLDNLANPMELLRSFGMAFENANRVGEFVRILEQEGIEIPAVLRAAKESRDVSVDFARRGSLDVVSALRPIAAFWNARMQGYDKILRRAFEDPKMTATRLFAAITAPTMVLYGVNRNNPDYWKRPMWERNLFWLVPLPEVMGGGFARIPKPFELGLMFASGPERLMEFIDPKNPEVGESTVDELLIENLGREVKEMLAPMPTLVEPFWQNAVNRAWNDIPVYSPADDLQKLEPRLKGRGRATAVGKAAADVIGDVPGATRLAEWLNVSNPAQIDNMITGFTGEIGFQALEQIDKVVNKAKGVSTPEERFRDRFLTRSFFARDPSRNTRLMEVFYDRYNRAEEAWNSARRWAETGNTDRARKLFEDNFDAVQGLADMREANRQLRDIRNLAEEVEKTDKLDATTKREMLDRAAEMMNQVAGKAIGWHETEGATEMARPAAESGRSEVLQSLDIGR